MCRFLLITVFLTLLGTGCQGGKKTSLTEVELRSFCRKHLAHFKIPHYFEFRDSLPKTRSGKIDKVNLLP